MTTGAAGIDTPLRAHVEQAFQLASGLHDEARLQEADKLYQFILAVMPTHYDTLFRLGTLRARANQMVAAVHLLCGGGEAAAGRCPVSHCRQSTGTMKPSPAIGRPSWSIRTMPRR